MTYGPLRAKLSRSLTEPAVLRRPVPQGLGSRGFTLVELLIVIGIMLILAAASIPAISAFRRGQRLEHAQRLVISTLNDARRLAITRHARHCVVLFRYEEKPGEADTIRHALRIYQDPTGIPKNTPGVPASVTAGYWPGGYQGGALRLPAGVRFKTDRMKVIVQITGEDGPDKDSPLFVRKLRGNENNDVIAFRRDGTVEDRGDETATASTGRNIYLPDEGYWQVPDSQKADIVVYESTADGKDIMTAGKTRRAMIDISSSTGRSIGRVFDVGGTAPETLHGGR